MEGRDLATLWRSGLVYGQGSLVAPLMEEPLVFGKL